jgi:hypothetical protein
LGVSTEAIKNFDEDKAINIFSNTFHDTNGLINYFPTFNTFERLLEAMEENKKLYERLLQSEREKVALLEKMLNKQ